MVTQVNKIGTYHPLTCKPLQLFPGHTCTINIDDELSSLCPAAEKLVAISWITGLSSIILAILWTFVIINICRIKGKAKNAKLLIAIPAIIAVIFDGLSIKGLLYFFTPKNLAVHFIPD